MVIDALVRLVPAQGADALTIAPDAPPCLDKGGEPRPLRMPALGQDMLAMVLEELTSPEQRETLKRCGTLEVPYSLPSGEAFAVQLEQTSRGVGFTFRPASATTSAPAASAPTRKPEAAPSPAPAVPPPSAPSLAFAPRVVPEPAPAVNAVLARAALEDASDIFFSTGRNARLRVGGELVELEHTTCEAEDVLALAGELDEAARAVFERHGSLDVAVQRTLEGRVRRYRVNLFRHEDGVAAALRPVKTSPPTLEALGLPADLHALTGYRHGLVLMTGTAGAGKSTTLVALIEHLNQTSRKHVLTIEDPIEYRYTPGRALIHQREVGRDVESFDAGLRAALREAPDVILVGEMRDRDTIAAALTAAETGHLVLSTLHCGHAVMAIDRIIDAFPQHQQAQVRLQLASVLRAIVTQVLLPGTRPPERVPAYEKLVVTTAVATKIREGRGHQLQSEIHKGKAEGMVALEASLAELVRGRRITVETAMATASDPELLRGLVGQR